MKRRDLLTPAQAEAAFYAAFEDCDLDAMMAVWSDDNDIMCIHPHGPRLIGDREVRNGWQRIMTHSPRMRFSISALNAIRNGDLAVRFVNESIQVGAADTPNFTVLSTNVYRRTPAGWRMVMHHASPAPESLRDTADQSDEGSAGGEVTVH